MNEQNQKLEDMKKSIAKVRKVMSVIRGILWAALVMCVVGCVLVGIFRQTIDTLILAGVQAGTTQFALDFTNDFALGLLGNAGLELQSMADAGQYSLVMIISMCIAAAMAGIVQIIFTKLIYRVKSIEQGGTPFTKASLPTFRRVFGLVSLLVGVMANVDAMLVVIVVFVCIYKMIEYAVTLQEQVDETL